MKKKNSKKQQEKTKEKNNNNNGTSQANLYEVGTLAVDGCAVTFGTARRGLGGLQPDWMDGWNIKQENNNANTQATADKQNANSRQL